jgi:putative (di)nucleoside polyphosphate hydrolase
MTTRFDDLPYRPCAGIMLTNMQGKIFVGQRMDRPQGTDAWQMPQGGIDEGEEAEAAALRELFEETGVRADLVDILARSKEEHFYDLPDDMIGRIWKGKYRGQRQIWFLMRFKGRDSDNSQAGNGWTRLWSRNSSCRLKSGYMRIFSLNLPT